ncbi:MAG: nucleotidyltransferase domain-containing protein [Candidatus Acidulodesulfobacterium acidiphilum]|uniref:Nucleotidyltransferase domain-containing protein n=1 Tax=Candidatus Acidulodesulfobacterium acidiphilum TaxID=2597224 RepID=A0A520XA78_9DELT|nr:MAG: nucleotidyltransferase domain-containing protein [Candidatus Acidulodesulfobacterium acidiphilum]RZV38109.1 MAG: nucleotidyltransferase domain-containing protein [Candidatus Acidulodesulfobacterium acidiphilum]
MVDEKNKSLILDSINKYLTELQKNDINIVGAYLFGSYSKNNTDKWSDIDLAILTDKFIGDSFDFTLLLMKIARNIDFNIEPHPYIADEFNKNNPFAAEIIKTGIRVL